jgi:hypothetical protein
MFVRAAAGLRDTAALRLCRAAADGVVFSGQILCRAQSQNCETKKTHASPVRKTGGDSGSTEIIDMKISASLCFFICVSTCAIMFLTGCGSKNVEPVTNTVTNYVTKTVTTLVTNTVTHETVKEVPVPAEIPDEYIWANKFLQRVKNASSVNADQALFGMKDVKVTYMIKEDLKQVVSEDEVKAKFELTLRRNNIPINPNSPNTVTLVINGFRGDDLQTQNLFFYSFRFSVYETQTISRAGELHNAVVCVWNSGDFYGYAGKNKANEALLGNVEKDGEMFSNDFLSANSKQKKLEREIFFADTEMQIWQQQLLNIKAGKNFRDITRWDAQGNPVMSAEQQPTDADEKRVGMNVSKCMQTEGKLEDQLRQLAQ